MTPLKPTRLAALLAGVVLPALALTSPAGAADLDVTGISAPAEYQSPWQIRLRGLGVVTEDEGSVDGVIDSGLSYSDTLVPELDISYFFTDNIAAELILGTTYANVNGDGSLTSMGRIGKTWLLPPTLTLQYHFTDFGKFKPYVGAGGTYAIFYSQDADGVDELDIENTFGATLQVGFDYMIDEHWGWNVDVKKIFLEPDFDVVVGGTRLSGKAKLNPWLIGTGVTYRF
ncbi:OmpW family protein [Aurantimonas sp. 22II-16-19i]|uniref:OmpW/AlkL family protein n=1 Tax=Aurantimonas sp. 22II-16-19i TaxID=1317114 RepID=UPI0009F7D167|nr:OmpW family protein [Aurantimonas sp. 22II-16-19i]ORE97131.1 OmpW family outer membrane protein [Aurantimonas sp. 22II-16-19i]